jgi:hypothetical protein
MLWKVEMGCDGNIGMPRRPLRNRRRKNTDSTVARIHPMAGPLELQAYEARPMCAPLRRDGSDARWPRGHVMVKEPLFTIGVGLRIAPRV